MTGTLPAVVWASVAAVAVVGAGWKLSQLVRAPDDRGLRLFAVCTVMVAVALSAQVVVAVPGLAARLPAGTPHLTGNALSVLLLCALLCFLRSTRSEEESLRWRRGEIALVLLVVATMIGLVVAAPTSVRDWTYESADPAVAVLAFYLVTNAYQAYVSVHGALLARDAARRTLSRARLGLRVVALGLVINVVFVHLVRVTSTALRLAGLDVVPPEVEAVSAPMLAVGIALFSLGLVLPGLRTTLVKARLWLRDRHRHARLRPLWERLVATFPAITLDPPSPWRDRLWPFGLRRRYYRRVVECRDGLVLLSPWADPEPADGTRSDGARRVAAALARHEAGAERTGTVTVLAPSDGTSMEADVAELLALSESVAALPAEPAAREDCPTI